MSLCILCLFENGWHIVALCRHEGGFPSNCFICMSYLWTKTGGGAGGDKVVDDVGCRILEMSILEGHGR